MARLYLRHLGYGIDGKLTKLTDRADNYTQLWVAGVVAPYRSRELHHYQLRHPTGLRLRHQL